jgi:hypothetical protein
LLVPWSTNVRRREHCLLAQILRVANFIGPHPIFQAAVQSGAKPPLVKSEVC